MHLPKQRPSRRLEEGEIRGTADEAAVPRKRARGDEGAMPRDSGRHARTERQRHDKPGNVVFCTVESTPRPLLTVDKRLVAPTAQGGSQKLVSVQPLLGSGPMETYPLSELDSLKDRLPSLFAGAASDEDLRALVGRCVRKQHERSGGRQTELEGCEALMPGKGAELLALVSR